MVEMDGGGGAIANPGGIGMTGLVVVAVVVVVESSAEVPKHKPIMEIRNSVCMIWLRLFFLRAYEVKMKIYQTNNKQIPIFIFQRQSVATSTSRSGLYRRARRRV